jgi:hypothetical protein
MGYRDEMHRALRMNLRQLRLDQLNLELRRLAVDVAITQTDVARLKLIEPEKPVTDPKAQSTAAPPTLARDLVDALTRLLDTQQQLIFTWGDYEGQRRLLDFALGTMQLDEVGNWIDPGPLTDETLIERYYDAVNNFMEPTVVDMAPGRAVLSPTELPPEPGETDMEMLVAPPSPE